MDPLKATQSLQPVHGQLVMWCGATLLSFVACGSPKQLPVDGDAAPAVYCDFYEPNNQPGTASQLEATMVLAAVCPAADHDFFSLSLAGEDDLIATINFELPANLDLRLIDVTSNAIIDESRGRDDFEVIQRTETLGNQLPEGDYLLEVYAAEDCCETDYRLTTSTGPGLVDAVDPM